jgi:diadenosine tetraphosphate (Ap4A) HIT family hydrolase
VALLPPEPYPGGRDRRSKKPLIAACLFFLFFGIVIGGWLFAKSQPRSVIALKGCDHCLAPSDLAGLLGSIGMTRFGNLLPFVIAETELSVVIKHPFPYAKVHYVVVPKKDIKDLGTIADADYAYVEDAMKIMRALIQREHLRAYRMFSNGPGLQSVTYLHFHLISKEDRPEIRRVEEELAREWRERSGVTP